MNTILFQKNNNNKKSRRGERSRATPSFYILGARGFFPSKTDLWAAGRGGLYLYPPLSHG